MNSIEKNKVTHLKSIKMDIDRKQCPMFSVGDDKTSYKGNQAGSVIALGSNKDSLFEKHI